MSKNRVKKWTENIKKAVKTPVSKANPFDKKINKDDVSDTGIETIKLANSGIKTVKQSIKTTTQTVKTTKNVVQKTGVAIYKTANFTVKSTILVSKFVGNVVANVIASLMNPVIIAFAAIILIFIMTLSFVVIILGGGVSASNSNQRAYSSAAGLVDVTSQYDKGKNYLNTALENHKNNFNSLIDSLYYNYDDLTNSTLVYMERTDSSGGKTIYEKSFSTDDRKNALKSEWNIPITEREFLAIAYVYLENEMNNSGNTEHKIYEVSYNQEVFDTIVSKCAVYSDTVYDGQKCPDENCTRHVEYIDNPEYQEAAERKDKSYAASLEWWDIANSIIENDNVVADEWRIENWVSVYGMTPYYSNNGIDFYNDLYNQYSNNYDIWAATPEKLEKVTYICEYKHSLHSIGLAFFDKETVMNALGFDDISKEWVELTEMGFENNPDIP